MNAMTWYDHETGSVWSQPWGRAIRGPLKGVKLNLLPFQLTSWGSWKAAHPETLVMTNDLERLGGWRKEFREDFVVGLILAGNARAYYFKDVEKLGLINDELGDIPIMVWAQGDQYQAFVRQVDDQVLTFRLEGEALVDQETGSVWDLTRGMAVDGSLGGKSLQAVPSLSSFDWAWEDFYPEGDFYHP
jgi:hypothetical protein